jgi:hypothetical protein
MAQVVPAAQAAADAAQSVHVAGTVIEGSQTDGINLSLVAPHSASGSVTEGGNTLSVVIVDGTYYVQITTAFLKIAGAPSPDCGTVCGKYVELPAADTNAVAGQNITIQQLFKDGFGAMPASARHNTADVFVPATYHGQPVLKASVAGTTVVVARGAKPYLLEVSTSNGNHVVFSEWNSVPPITAPPASDIVSPAALGGL